MTTSSLIRASEAKLTLNPTPIEALEAINSALSKSALVPDEIDTEIEQAQAVNAQRDIAALLKEIEKARVSAKQPAIDFGRLVDARAKELIKELEPEQLRIAKAIGNYQQREIEKVREAQRRADAERAEVEKRYEGQSDEVSIERKHQELESIPKVVAAPKAEGQSVRKEIRIEITDIWTLAKMHPGLVKIEPRNAEIKEMIRLGYKVAGVRSWEETVSSVRVGKQQQVLEV